MKLSVTNKNKQGLGIYSGKPELKNGIADIKRKRLQLYNNQTKNSMAELNGKSGN